MSSAEGYGSRRSAPRQSCRHKSLGLPIPNRQGYLRIRISKHKILNKSKGRRKRMCLQLRSIAILVTSLIRIESRKRQVQKSTYRQRYYNWSIPSRPGTNTANYRRSLAEAPQHIRTWCKCHLHPHLKPPSAAAAAVLPSRQAPPQTPIVARFQATRARESSASHFN